MKRAKALQIVVEFARAHGAGEVLDAVAALAPKPKQTVEPSERGLKFADWFRTTLSADVNLATGWREKWAVCFDAMIRLDARTPEQIAAVCAWARAHHFWRGAFLSPLKLRERRAGTTYFDRFAEAMQQGGKAPARREQPRGYALPEGTAPKAVRASDLLK